jgi:hypothetical protein
MDEEIPSVVGYEVRAESRLGEILGFRDDLFHGTIEILEDGRLYLYYISSKSPMEGNTTRLLQHWIYMGFDVHVVRPCPEMQRIITRLGFEEQFEELPHRYQSERNINVWRKV